MIDARTWENWKKVKEALERQGKTNSEFYRRACKVVNGTASPFAGQGYEHF